MSTRLLQQFRETVGSEHVVVEPQGIASYAIDWTGRFRGIPRAVIRPGDGAEIAAVAALCKEADVALVPQGGNTGYVGGRVPLAGEVVLSLRRLAGVTDVDTLGGQLSAGAGTTVSDVQAAAADAGWAYGVDLGSRDSATIGRTVATNAAGPQGAPPLHHEGAARGLRSCARDERHCFAHWRTHKGQHGVRPRRVALRQRRNARSGDRRMIAPSAAEPGAVL